jgi:nitroreductase
MTGEEHLEWLRSRRSVRTFTDAPVERAPLERLFEAAVTAPSSSNRQPWRFACVVSASHRAQIVGSIRQRSDEIKAVIRRGHHADDFGSYGDFFWEPLESASVIIIPQVREYPDLIADLIRSGGEDPARFHTAAEMQAELCSTSAAVMGLLLQARAEGLGACWMAGPTVARADIEALLGIAAPWRMLGAIALGHPTLAPASPGRKPLAKVVQWFDDSGT